MNYARCGPAGRRPRAPRPVIRFGSTGRAVAELQRLLTALGYYRGCINGLFGAETERATRHFQRDHCLVPDGIVGPRTWAAAFEELEEESPWPPEGTFIYVVEEGDTLFSIAGRFNTTVEELMALNDLTLTTILVGQELLIPITEETPAPPLPVCRPPLQMGDTGEAVQVLQMMLQLLDFYFGPINSMFDMATEQAVLEFQRVADLTIDGIVRPSTWEALAAAVERLQELPEVPAPECRPTLQLGDAGQPVQVLQMMLYILGYFAGPISAVFEDATEQGVIAFQQNYGLEANGIVGPETWAALSGILTPPPPPPPLPPVEIERPPLLPGDTGDDVQVLQLILRLLGYYSGPINAVFDMQTEQAVIAFQQNNGLVPNGMVDAETWAALNAAVANLPPLETRPVLRQGDTGEAVQVLQMMLTILGYYDGPINSVFDTATEQAVISFQQVSGLMADGVVGPSTWAALDAAVAQSPEPTPPIPPPENRPTVRLGDSGPYVAQLKNMLTELGYYTGAISETFDALLVNAVTSFQRDYNLTPDGIVGPLTWAAIDGALYVLPTQPTRPILNQGDNAQAVVFLQGMLRFLGYYYGPITRQYTAETRAAVAQFQGDNGLVADGAVGPITWAALDTAMAQFTVRYPVIRVGDTGPAVARLQRLLTMAGLYGGAVNGNYTEQLATAVRSFQSNQGLSVDGVVGPLTWRALENWQDLLARDAISLCWSPNPSTFNIATNAFDVMAPVWYELATDSGNNLIIDPRRASLAYVQEAHQRGISVWGTVQSFNAPLTRRLVTSDTEITRFITSMINYSNAHQLDGLCIDFEYMYVADRDQFSAFVRRVGAALKSNAAAQQKQYVMSVCFTRPPAPGDVNNMWSASVDRVAVGRICDYSCLMLYDEHGAGTAAGPIASQSWAISGLNDTLAQVPNNRLLMGVPFYSAKWPSRTGGTIMYLTMNMIQSLLDNGSFTDRNGQLITVQSYTVAPVYQDGELRAEFIDTNGNNNVIWGQTPQTISNRLTLVPQYDLPGACFWEYYFSNAAAWEVVRTQLRGL